MKLQNGLSYHLIFCLRVTPKQNYIDQFGDSGVKLIHKSLKESFLNTKKFPYSLETQKLIKLKRKQEKNLKPLPQINTNFQKQN